MFLVGQFEVIYQGLQHPACRRSRRLLIVVADVGERGLAPRWIVGGVVVCAWLAARVFFPRAAGGAAWRPASAVGAVWRSTSLAEFCHLLALLLESRLPLPEALRLTGEGVEDADSTRDAS